jgi:hypothetical protein
LCVDDRWQNEKERRDGKSKADHLCGYVRPAVSVRSNQS